LEGNRCPNCGVELINSEGEKVYPIVGTEGIYTTDSFVTKVKKLRDKFDITACEIGHGYAVFEAKFQCDVNKVREVVRAHLQGVFRGWDYDMNEKMKQFLVIDNGYDATKPDDALPKIILEVEEAETVAPNEKEESADDDKKS
jgi:hypothetical protein